MPFPGETVIRGWSRESVISLSKPGTCAAKTVDRHRALPHWAIPRHPDELPQPGSALEQSDKGRKEEQTWVSPHGSALASSLLSPRLVQYIALVDLGTHDLLPLLVINASESEPLRLIRTQTFKVGPTGNLPTALLRHTRQPTRSFCRLRFSGTLRRP